MLARAECCPRDLTRSMKTLLSFVFALTLAAPLARAEDVLEIPEPCGSASELAREINALRATSRSAAVGQRPDVHITQDASGYVLSVELPDGRRMLRDTDCRALFRAAIVIAALGHESSIENVLGAVAQDGAAEPAPSQAPAAPPQLEPVQAATPRAVAQVRKPERRRPRAVRGDDRLLYPRKLSARALVRAELSYGVVPPLSGLFGLGIALEYAHFAGRATFSYLGPPGSHEDGQEGVRVDALSGSLTLEYVVLPYLRPGLGADFYALHGRGSGGLAPTSAWATQGTLHAGLALRVLQRSAFWLEFSARALWAPKPASFLMQGRSPVYSTSPWGLSAGIHAGYQFL
jgi:hypothetical protein